MRLRAEKLRGSGLNKFGNVNLNQMKLQKFNIGIIGGGIGGVAAAVALHRAGIEATVYERATEFPKSARV